MIAGIVGACAVIIISAVAAFVLYRRWRKRKRTDALLADVELASRSNDDHVALTYQPVALSSDGHPKPRELSTGGQDAMQNAFTPVDAQDASMGRTTGNRNADETDDGDDFALIHGSGAGGDDDAFATENPLAAAYAGSTGGSSDGIFYDKRRSAVRGSAEASGGRSSVVSANPLFADTTDEGSEVDASLLFDANASRDELEALEQLAATAALLEKEDCSRMLAQISIARVAVDEASAASSAAAGSASASSATLRAVQRAKARLRAVRECATVAAARLPNEERTRFLREVEGVRARLRRVGRRSVAHQAPG